MKVFVFKYIPKVFEMLKTIQILFQIHRTWLSTNDNLKLFLFEFLRVEQFYYVIWQFTTFPLRNNGKVMPLCEKSLRSLCEKPTSPYLSVVTVVQFEKMRLLHWSVCLLIIVSKPQLTKQPTWYLTNVAVAAKASYCV